MSKEKKNQREPLEVQRLREIRKQLDETLLDEYIELYNRLLANFIGTIKINLNEPDSNND
jgi:hypothetical protein|tara:strand:- start:217 stop:396 length:180 start_codon:yes stop_codon:yes gene_type:complete